MKLKVLVGNHKNHRADNFVKRRELIDFANRQFRKLAKKNLHLPILLYEL